jgi:Aspartyl protease/PDZ domain
MPALFTPTPSVFIPRNGITLAFENRQAHILLSGLVSGSAGQRPIRLILDSGAGGLLLDINKLRSWGLKPSGKATVTGAGNSAAQVVQIPSLAFGEARLENIGAFAAPIPQEMQADGLIGYDLISRLITKIDYANGQVTLLPQAAFAPPTGGNITMLPLQFEHNIPVTYAQVDGIKGTFEIDTGASGSLILFKPFVEKNGLRNRYYPRVETITGKGIGGYLEGDLVNLKELTLGGFTMTKVLTDLSRQTAGGFFSETHAGNIGAEILSRFTVTFNYAHKKLYLQKNSEYSRRYDVPRAGIVVDAGGDGTIIVVSISPRSPAAEAGIEKGEKILVANGVNAKRLHPEQINGLFHAPVGTVVQLAVQSNKKGSREVSFTLRDLL